MKIYDVNSHEALNVNSTNNYAIDLFLSAMGLQSITIRCTKSDLAKSLKLCSLTGCLFSVWKINKQPTHASWVNIYRSQEE
jgi:hypothetical protein